MIFGLRRYMALAAAISMSLVVSVKATEKHFVIPETVPAIDLNTGGPYYAPPVPGGHYTKDTLGAISNKLHGGLAHLKGAAMSLCSNCGGSGQCHGCGQGAATGGLGACGHCGGSGYVAGNGNHAGHSHYNGTPVMSGAPVVQSAGHGSHGGGNGLFAGHGGKAVVATVPSGNGLVAGHHGAAKASPQNAASPQGGASPSNQSACANGGCGGSNCGDPACHGILGRKGLFSGHKAGAGNGCGTPGCSSPGCGNGNGLFAGHGAGNGCGTPGCSSPGCGNGGMGHPGLGHSGMGHPGLGSKLAGLLGHNKVKYFVGPGGPVPITPGYVQWVNPVRSPRDFFAFPPYLDQAMEPGYGSMPQSSAGFATDRATSPTGFVAPVPPPAPSQPRN